MKVDIASPQDLEALKQSVQLDGMLGRALQQLEKLTREDNDLRLELVRERMLRRRAESALLKASAVAGLMTLVAIAWCVRWWLR